MCLLYCIATGGLGWREGALGSGSTMGTSLGACFKTDLMIDLTSGGRLPNLAELGVSLCGKARGPKEEEVKKK